MSLLTAKRAHILVVLSCAARVLRRTQREKADDARAPSTLGAVRPAAARGRLCSRSGRIAGEQLIVRLRVRIVRSAFHSSHCPFVRLGGNKSRPNPLFR